MNRRTRVEGMWLGGEELHTKGSFIHKPSQGWLHPDKKIVGQGASYIVRYMGCIEVLKSMRSLDFNTRTQVTSLHYSSPPPPETHREIRLSVAIRPPFPQVAAVSLQS
uniref:SHC (Src homology 2 domain containing) transforming protein 2 n=1 Tax=Poecilia latipinna TaxID=48699 RepID=A0A3B3TV51_9TELE